MQKALFELLLTTINATEYKGVYILNPIWTKLKKKLY